MRTLAAAAVLAALSGCATVPADGGARAVTVEGWAPEGPGDRVRALADARKRAVEEALGVAVAAATKVEDALTVKRRVWAASLGRVEDLKVLSERVEGGMRVVRVRAAVRRAAEGEAVPPPAEATVRLEAEGPAAEALRRAFGEAGFTVVRSSAEFTATASVTASTRVDPRTAPFVTGRSRVAVAVVEAATGVLVAERSMEAAGLEKDALSAAAAAGAQAGFGAGRAAAGELSSYLWKR